jgi:predicted ArsR family transcriptional regulator
MFYAMEAMTVKKMKQAYEMLTQAPLSTCNVTEKLVWLYIHHNGEARYTVKDVAEALGVTIKTAHAALNVLEGAGLLLQHREVLVTGGGRRGRAGTIRRAIEPQAVGMVGPADPTPADSLPS